MKILVADDDMVCRRMVEVALKKCGFDVQAANDGEEARQILLAKDAPQFAILDWGMPKMDGVDVVRNVREQRPFNSLFIIMLTARSDKGDLATALDAGANDYISKPFNSTELKARLQVGQRLLGYEGMPSTIVKAPVQELTGTDDRSILPGDDHPTPYDAMQKKGYLTPMFDPESMKFTFGVAAPFLRAWEQDGTLDKVLLDRVELCPKCHGVPTYRFGCPGCGSGRVDHERLIHHYACAHVAPVREFEQEGQLICPKCRVRDLVVGADFEHLNGPYHCLDCAWTATELEHVAHCLLCGFRFPAHQAFVQDLIGYHSQERNIIEALPAPN